MAMTIAVYGANGFQGRLVLGELVRRGIEPVLVGRDAARLAAAGFGGAERRVAGTADRAALVAALRGCAAVVNCAGPFTVSGLAVVRAAVAAGCHYVDTAGEQRYLKQVFDTVEAEAKERGVTVVPAASDGAVPVDLLGHLIAARTGPLEQLTTVHVITGGGGPSRGSLRSMLETIDVIRSGGLTYADGGWHDDAPADRLEVTLPGAAEPVPVVRFALPEIVTLPRHVDVRRVLGYGEAALAALLSTPIDAAVIDTLPEGPGAADRAAQRFTYVVDALTVDGSLVRGTVRGRDTYGTTAVIAVEAAVRLAAGGVRPGVLAPAEAFDPRDFLGRIALDWTIEAAEQQPYSGT